MHNVPDKKTIVLIDDEAGILENVTELLEFAGYRVISAKDGEDGAQAVKEHQPDLVLCDLMMPGADGYSLLNEFRNDPELAHIPVIIMSGDAQRSTIMKTLQHGAVSFIAKPFDVDHLMAVIEEHSQ